MISTKCVHTIYEMGQYRYPERRDEQAETSVKRFELPLKKDDHTPEALGRFLAGRYHAAATQYGGNTKISHAKFLRGLGNDRGSKYGDQPAGIGSHKNTHKRGTWMQ